MKTAEEYAELSERCVAIAGKETEREVRAIYYQKAQVYATLSQAAALMASQVSHLHATDSDSLGSNLTANKACACWNAGYSTGCDVNY